MIFFKQYALTASAVALSDNTIFGSLLPSTTITKVQQLIIRNATGAVNLIYGGGPTVTNVPANAGFQIAAATDRDFGPLGSLSMDLRDIFIVGTVNAANIAFITVVL